MPRSAKSDRELTDEELKQVVGGSKNMKFLFENWRNHAREKIRDVLPHAEVKYMEKIGSSVLPPDEQKQHDMDKYGYVREPEERDIDVEVEVSGISNEDVETWADSEEAQELEDEHNLDVQLRIVESWRKFMKEDIDLKMGTFFEHPHQNLNESLWDENDQLKPEVKEKLLEIAQQFISKTQGADAEIKDITFTGSLANYNYSMLSDIDLHILIDFEDLNEDIDLVKDYFNAVKALWNYLHDIRIKGYEVEVYVQDGGLVGAPEAAEAREEHISSGVYSITNDEWIRKPEYKKAEIDSESIANKAESLMDQIDRALALMDKEKYEEAYRYAIKLRNKIKKFRQAGLESAGEYSIENLAFKTLRNNGYLGKLSNLKRDAYDKMMSLKENK